MVTAGENMEEQLMYPHWLESSRLDDALLAASYENTGAWQRSIIKMTIARLHAIWGLGLRCKTVTSHPDSGFTHTTEKEPVPFTLVFCHAGYHFPACFAAALMPAVLAGCQCIIPCFLESAQNLHDPLPADLASSCLKYPHVDSSEQHPKETLLATLDLIGIDHAFLIHSDQCMQLVQDMIARHGTRGRVLVLDHSFNAQRAADLLAAGVGLWSAPVLPQFCSIVHCECDQTTICRDTSLYLDEAHEHTWVWPELSPDWFMNVSFHLNG